MMQDFIFANLASQELARETRKHQFGNLDPDEMYKEEMWDSLDSAPTFKQLINRIVSRFGRRNPDTSQQRGDDPKVLAQSTQCAPQG